jgi:hypothetical protein
VFLPFIWGTGVEAVKAAKIGVLLIHDWMMISWGAADLGR